jgi:hypothetical protein
MKKNSEHSRKINRISRRDSLPLLRGMFVSPKKSPGEYSTTQKYTIQDNASDNGLFLNSETSYYLGV